MDERENSMREQKKNILRRQIIKHEPEDEFEAKLRAHRRRIWIIIGVTILVLAAVYIGYRIYDANRNLTTYKENWSVSLESTDSTYTGYTVFGAGILKYGRSGASYLNAAGETVWSAAYEMKSPTAQTCGAYAVIADLNSNSFVILNVSEQLIAKAVAPGPITRATVAGQGVVSILVQEDLADRILFYKRDGSQLDLEVRTAFAEDGYPLDIALSENGQILQTSYVFSNNGEVQSRVAFYNFGEEGQKYSDRLVGGFDYTNAMIPRVRILGDSAAVAFGDSTVSFFSLKKVDEPQRLAADHTFDHEIRSIFYSSSYVGVIESTLDSETFGLMHIYDASGTEILQQAITFDYSDAQFAGDEILLYNTQGAVQLLTLDGHQKFSGNLEGGITYLTKGSGKNQLIVVGAGRIWSCTLK